MIPDKERYHRRKSTAARRIDMVETDLFWIAQTADACHEMATEMCVPGGGADHQRADHVMAIALAVRNLALDAQAELEEIRGMLERRGADEPGTS